MDEAKVEPTLSEAQALWLTYRIDARTDDEATRRYSEDIAPLDPAVVAAWHEDRDFTEILASLPKSKKKAFLVLTENLFPAVYRALRKLIVAGSPKDAAKGTELLLKVHGMLTERVRTEDAGEVEAMLRLLRRQSDAVSLQPWQRNELGEIVQGEVRLIGESGD